MHILTFDIEDWFHVLENPRTADIEHWNEFPSRIECGVQRLLDFCDEAKLKATFFILGWVAETAPDVVAEIARRGHEIACHSYRHQLVYTQTPDDFERDLVMALDHIESAAGIRPIAYRAPGFSITKQSAWAFEILAKNGITIDASVFPSSRAHGGIEDFPCGKPCILSTFSGSTLKLFPMSYATVLGRRIIFSGGGYFRLLPYQALQLGFKRSEYVMTYFHPRDFDSDQPIIPGLSASRRFKSYVGLGTSLSRLTRIALNNRLISIGSAEEGIDWSNVPRFSSDNLFPALKPAPRP